MNGGLKNVPPDKYHLLTFSKHCIFYHLDKNYLYMNIFLIKPEDHIIETKNIQGLIQMTRNICKIGNMLEKRKPESKHSFFVKYV